MLNKILIGLALIALSGCATAWDTKLYDSYTKGSSNSHEYAFLTVDSKADAIAWLSECKDCTLAEEMLLKVIISRDIASIEAPDFSIDKPTLNTENVKHITDVITSGIPIFGMMRVTESVLENDRGITTLSSDGGDIVMKDSLNRTEVHSVANDGSTASTTATTDTSEDSSVEVM